MVRATYTPKKEAKPADERVYDTLTGIADGAKGVAEWGQNTRIGRALRSRQAKFLDRIPGLVDEACVKRADRPERYSAKDETQRLRRVINEEVGFLEDRYRASESEHDEAYFATKRRKDQGIPSSYDDVEPRVDTRASTYARANESVRNVFASSDRAKKARWIRAREAALQGILPEAFANVQHALTQLQGREYQVLAESKVWDRIKKANPKQLVAGGVLNFHKVAEQETGEGKTLTAVMAAYLNAIDGLGVHILTPNDYLSEVGRDKMLPLFEELGLSVGLLKEGQSVEDKRVAYACDVVYGKDTEFGFDYLRNLRTPTLEGKFRQDAYFAIIDEVDEGAIKKARNPLIMSRPDHEKKELEDSEIYGILNEILTDRSGKLVLEEAKLKPEYDPSTGRTKREEKHKKLEAFKKRKKMRDPDELYGPGDFIKDDKHAIRLTQQGEDKVRDLILRSEVGRGGVRFADEYQQAVAEIQEESFEANRDSSSYLADVVTTQLVDEGIEVAELKSEFSLEEAERTWEGSRLAPLKRMAFKRKIKKARKKGGIEALHEDGDLIFEQDGETAWLTAEGWENFGHLFTNPAFGTTYTTFVESGRTAAEAGNLVELPKLVAKELYARIEEGARSAVHAVPFIGDVLNVVGAHTRYHRGQHYNVIDGKIALIDQHTGFVAANTTIQEGMHQAIEAKEGVEFSNVTDTVESITLQTYLTTQYIKLAGLTGTGQGVGKELERVYGLDVLPVERNTPCQRVDEGYEVFPDNEKMLAALEEEVEDAMEQGFKETGVVRPVLIAATADEAPLHTTEQNGTVYARDIYDRLKERGRGLQELTIKLLSEERLGEERQEELRTLTRDYVGQRLLEVEDELEAQELENSAETRIIAAEATFEESEATNYLRAQFLQLEEEFFRLGRTLTDGQKQTIHASFEDYLETEIVELERELSGASFADVAGRMDSLASRVVDAGTYLATQVACALPIDRREAMERAANVYSELKLVTSKEDAVDPKTTAEAFEKAGEEGAGTISTKMSGRGVDYIISDEVDEAGGLAVFGVGIQDSTDAVAQLRGRAGRQGQKGSSKFFASLEDHMLKTYSGFGRVANKVQGIWNNAVEQDGVGRGDTSDITARDIQIRQKSAMDNEAQAREAMFSARKIANSHTNMMRGVAHKLMEARSRKESPVPMLAELCAGYARRFHDDIKVANAKGLVSHAIRMGLTSELEVARTRIDETVKKEISAEAKKQEIDYVLDDLREQLLKPADAQVIEESAAEQWAKLSEEGRNLVLRGAIGTLVADIIPEYVSQEQDRIDQSYRNTMLNKPLELAAIEVHTDALEYHLGKLSGDVIHEITLLVNREEALARRKAAEPSERVRELAAYVERRIEETDQRMHDLEVASLERSIASLEAAVERGSSSAASILEDQKARLEDLETEGPISYEERIEGPKHRDIHEITYELERRSLQQSIGVLEVAAEQGSSSAASLVDYYKGRLEALEDKGPDESFIPSGEPVEGMKDRFAEPIRDFRMRILRSTIDGLTAAGEPELESIREYVSDAREELEMLESGEEPEYDVSEPSSAEGIGDILTGEQVKQELGNLLGGLFGASTVQYVRKPRQQP